MGSWAGCFQSLSVAITLGRTLWADSWADTEEISYWVRTSRGFLSCGPIPTADERESRRRRRRRRVAERERRREMAPAGRGWSRTVGNTRSFVGNALGGLRGWSNLASWAVAGTLAYYLWVRPARQLQKEQEVSSPPPPLPFPISLALCFARSSSSHRLVLWIRDLGVCVCCCSHLHIAPVHAPVRSNPATG